MKPAALIAFALASHASIALACSCVQGLYLMSPTEDVVAPVNARVFLGDGVHWSLLDEGASPTLHQADGTLVDTQLGVIESGLGKLFVLTPEALLTEGATYEVRADDSPVNRFTVSGNRLEGTPPLPRVIERDGSTYHGRGGGDCGDSFYVSWTLNASGTLLLVDRDHTTTFDPSTVSGRVAAVNTTNPTGPSLTSLGTFGCGATWKEATPGAEVGARFGVLDAAGNFSGWTSIDRNQVPRFGCGCGTGSEALVAIGLLALLRRRRTSR